MNLYEEFAEDVREPGGKSRRRLLEGPGSNVVICSRASRLANSPADAPPMPSLTAKAKS